MRPLHRGLFDDHSEALTLWKEAGLSGLTCLHVDAHLDVMADGFDPATLDGVAQARGALDLNPLKGQPELPWGGLHCGNFLYPALLDGTVTTLIWVLPPQLLQPAPAGLLAAVLKELRTWVDPTFEEYGSFVQEDGRVEGTLLGRRLVVCTSDSLPDLSGVDREKLALDIDVDYFVRLEDDRMWQTPHALRDRLEGLEPVALTVATSCQGGYTPLSQRYLGKLCLELFSGSAEAWRGEMLAVAQAEEGGGEEEWEALLELVPPAWRPSLLSRLGRHEEAAAGDPAHRPDPLNQAARLLQQQRREEALELLDQLEGAEASRLILAASVDPALGSEQAERWEEFLARDDLSGPEQVRLWMALANHCLEQGQARRAVSWLKQVVDLRPDFLEGQRRLAQALLAAGQTGPAGRVLRKALELSRGRLSSLPVLLESWRMHQYQGQEALARVAFHELKRCDPTGEFAGIAQLERSVWRRPT